MRVSPARTAIAGVAAALLLTTATVACSSKDSDRTSGSSTTRAVGISDQPKFEKPGPYGVGVTTLHLGDGRAVEVYYPADKTTTAGKPREHYDQAEPVPAAIRAAYPIPAGVDLQLEIPAVRDVAVSSTDRATGGFPLLVFSHGSGGWRDVYGNLLSGIASWGFVAASTDYTEYGLIAGFSGTLDDGESHAAEVKAAVDGTIALMTAESKATGGRFADAIDPTRIAAGGHSAGGGTMFRLLDDKRISTIIGWAPVGPPTPVTSNTPTLIIGGDIDSAVTPAEVTAAYDALRPPKRVVSIAKMGHNAFTDTCVAIHNGTDIIGIAKQMKVPIPDAVLELGRNGCAAADLDVATGWKVIQHLTVAQLRASFRLDPVPVGLGDGITTAFPGVTMTYRHSP